MLCIKYIRKDVEHIYIYDNKYYWQSNVNKYNLRYWNICYGINYNTWATEIIEKKFFTFLYLGDNFPQINKYKEILPVLKKYKFSKVYVSRKSSNGDVFDCYFFKRGVLFNSVHNINDNSIKTLSTKRLFKLLKIKNRRA